MKKYRFTALLMAMLLTASILSPAAQAAQAPNVMAEAALLMDAANDEILYEKNARERMYPASLTKVMTALLVLEEVDAGRLSLDQVVTASNTFSTGLTANGSTQDIRAGEQMTLRDLLYCLLVASANESANILAETVDGTISAFVERMNQKATQLGCENTHFANPHGLHVDDHYTTAHDIYRIARAAMENDTFRTIVSTRSYEIPATNMHKARVFYSTNALLVTWYYRESYLYDKAIGIKTGTTDEGGYCLLSAAKNGEDYLISVVLNAPMLELEGGGTDRRQFTESRELFKWGFSNFTRRQIVDTDTPLAQVEVTLSQTDHVLVRPAHQLERTLPRDLKLEDIKQEIVLDAETVQAPVEAGQPLGKLTLTYQGQELGQIDLVAVSAAERSQLLYYLNQIQSFFQNTAGKLVAVILIVALAILILRKTVLRPRSRYGSRYSGRRRNYTGRRR